LKSLLFFFFFLDAFGFEDLLLGLLAELFEFDDF
jgi:hypothetical protein